MNAVESRLWRLAVAISVGIFIAACQGADPIGPISGTTGTDEVIVVAGSITDEASLLADEGDYSVALLRVVVARSSSTSTSITTPVPPTSSE